MFLKDKSEEAFERKTLIPLQTESVKSTMFNHTDILKHSSRSVSPVLVDLEAENQGQTGSMTSPVLVDLVVENTRSTTSSTDNSRHEMQAISNYIPEVENYKEPKLENLRSDTEEQAGNEADGSMEKVKALNGTESVEADYIAFTSPSTSCSLEQEPDSLSDSLVSPESIMHNVIEDKDIKTDLNLTNGSDPLNHSSTNTDNSSLPSLKSSTLFGTKILGIIDTIGSPSNKRKNVNGSSRKRKKKEKNDINKWLILTNGSDPLNHSSTDGSSRKRKKRKKNDIPSEPTPEPQVATTSFVETTGKPLQLLITDKKYPDVRLRRNDLIKLQRDVNLEILRLPEHEKLPLFKKVRRSRGGIHITCEDDYAQNWITNKLPYLRSHGRRPLIIYKFITVTARILCYSLKTRYLLTLISKMNPGLDTSAWIYYSCTKHHISGYQVTFGIDAKSMKELMRLNGKVRLGLGELKFRYNMAERKDIEK